MYLFGEANWEEYNKLGFAWEMGITGKLMRVCGIWPFSGRRGNFNFWALLLLLAITIPSRVQALFGEWENEEIVTCFVTLTEISATIRFCTFKIQGRQIRVIFKRMKNNWNDARYLRLDKKNVLYDYGKESQVIINGLMILLSLGAILYLPLPWIKSMITGKPVKLVAGISYPFATESSPIHELIFILHCIAYGSVVLILICTESCFMIIARHCRAQLKILCTMIDQGDKFILHYNPRFVKNYDEWKEKHNCSCMSCIVQRHIAIIEFFELTKNFADPFLSIAGMILVIQSTIFMILFRQQIAHDGIIFLTLFLCLEFAPQFVGFLYCWLGQKITDESQSIGNFLYYSNRGMDSQRDASIFITMLYYCRNRPMILTFSKYFELSHQLFKSYIVLRYTFLSFIQSQSRSSP